MNNRSKAVLWVVAVFLTGTLLGSAVTYMLRPAPPERGPRLQAGDPAGDPPPPPGGRIEGPGSNRPGGAGFGPDRPGDQAARKAFQELRLLAQHLELKPDQRRQLRRIVRETRSRWEVTHKEFKVRREQIRNDMLRSIRSMLDPGQKELFDDYVENRRERLRNLRQRYQQRHPRRDQQRRK